MTRCKYWDCGWCYCKTGNSNDINGKCMTPKECPQLAWHEQPTQQPQNEDDQMTEQNIRDAFERDKYYGHLNKLIGNDGVYIGSFTMTAYAAFKAGWIAAFKVILESENE